MSETEQQARPSVLARYRESVGVGTGTHNSVAYHRSGHRNDVSVFPYMKLLWINYHPSFGIIVHYGSHTVFIKGTRLEPVLSALRTQRLGQLRVNEDVEDPKSPVVERIYIRQKGDDDSFKFPSKEQLEDMAQEA